MNLIRWWCFLIIVLSSQSYALSPLYSFRHLIEQTHVSPSPSPSDGSNYHQACSNKASRSCQMKNITACLTYYSQSETRLFVFNNGESEELAKIMILPVNNTIKEINITSHQMKEVNISSEVDLSSGIVLTTSNGDCVISTVPAPPPEYHDRKYPSHGPYITPTNGAYLVILLLIIGGILTFFKLRTRRRHFDGVPYHELEMGNPNAANMDENETENWDEDWGDQWDDEKPVKSGGDNHVGVKVKQANGLITKLPNSNGKKKEWDD